MSKPSKGYLCLVLHAHLPFVRHPENDDFLEEDWLYEAMAESYLPLLDVLERLRRDAVPFRLTLSISPPLAEMLSDALLQQRFERRLTRLVDLAEKEVKRTSRKHYQVFHESARMYRDLFERSLRRYVDDCGRNLLNGFRSLQEAGCLELITSAATHGFLPLMETAQAVRAQLAVALHNHRRHFGRRPRGIWLPECGYEPRLDDLLESAGLEYFFLDAHGLLAGAPTPRHGVYAPVRTPYGAVAFARDVNASRQVWSREIGYPGDFEYREFYRDLGYDAFYDSIRPYLHNDGVRRGVGIKYHRITGEHVDLADKQPYRPEIARERADLHAADFLEHRRRQIEEVAGDLDRPPMVVAPFDAELFGHWWFEGPAFIESLLRRMASGDSGLEAITPGDYLARHPDLQTVQPAASSWGHRGHYDVWLNESNDWIYRHLHQCERAMAELAAAHPEADGLPRRALNQAARELLLAQSSDWAFIMTSNSASTYARRRTREHIYRFLTLEEQIRAGEINESFLKDVEWRDTLFPELDYRVYRDPSNVPHSFRTASEEP